MSLGAGVRRIVTSPGYSRKKCAVQVTGSGVHDYLRTRSRARTRRAENIPMEQSQRPISQTVAADTLAAAQPSEEVQRKIAAVKARITAAEPPARGFEYDPDQP